MIQHCAGPGAAGSIHGPFLFFMPNFMSIHPYFPGSDRLWHSPSATILHKKESYVQRKITFLPNIPEQQLNHCPPSCSQTQSNPVKPGQTQKYFPPGCNDSSKPPRASSLHPQSSMLYPLLRLAALRVSASTQLLCVNSCDVASELLASGNGFRQLLAPRTSRKDRLFMSERKDED